MPSGGDVRERLNAALADRYRIEREIGSGGMATVYLAHDLRHNRKVAVKVMDPAIALVLGADRFLLEIETVANLTHPHILPLHDSGEADGFLFYVLPYVKGDTLRSRIAREGQIPVRDAIRITREIASALNYAHGEGVIHRDVKPANIMFEAGHAVLTDFGVAHVLATVEDQRLTRTGASLGTPTYMSPEQVTGQKDLDGSSDQYALACVLFEMLAGEPPFKGETSQSLLYHHVAVAPPRIESVRTDVPANVAAALQRALSKTPSERFVTASQFGEALDAEQEASPRGRGPLERAVILRALVGLAAVVILVLVGRAVSRGLVDPRSPGPPPPDRPYTLLSTVEGSADADIRETVQFLLRSALDVAHVVQTVPSKETQRVLRLMERPDTTPVDPNLAREVAERLGVSTVVLPRFDVMGAGFLVAVRVEDVEGGYLVAEARRQAADAGALIETIDALAIDLRRSLGESRAVLANNEPLPLVLTPSLEALRAYRNGVALFRNFQPAAAVPQFREALTLDPEFSAAHVELSAAYHNAGVADSVVVHLRRALETPDRLTLLQRRDTEAYLKYASDFALWDESMFQTGYRNRDALRLADFQYADSAWAIIMSEVRDVVRYTRHFDREALLSTDDDNRWRNAIRLAIVTGHLEVLNAFVDSAQVETGEYWELMKSFHSSDWARADSLVGANPGAWDSHVNKRMAVSALDAVRGRVRESYDTWRLIPSRRVNPARVKLVFEAVYGVTAADTVVSLDDRGLEAVENYISHGVRSAMIGDTATAVRVVARLRAARDSATSQLFEQAFEPMFALSDGCLAARRSDWREVTRLLQPSADRLVEQGYGLSTDRFLVRWMLAEAYRQLGDLEKSIQQLEALLRERSFEPLHVLVYGPARFKLGQLYSEIQDSEAAVGHFTAFLDAFTDPDPEYQWMVDEARAAVATLRG